MRTWLTSLQSTLRRVGHTALSTPQKSTTRRLGSSSVNESTLSIGPSATTSTPASLAATSRILLADAAPEVAVAAVGAPPSVSAGSASTVAELGSSVPGASSAALASLAPDAKSSELSPSPPESAIAVGLSAGAADSSAGGASSTTGSSAGAARSPSANSFAGAAAAVF